LLSDVVLHVGNEAFLEKVDPVSSQLVSRDMPEADASHDLAVTAKCTEEVLRVLVYSNSEK